MRAFAQAERFVSEVEARKLRPAYVFVGDEVFFRKHCRDAILRSLVPSDLREFSLFDFDLGETDLAEVLDRARSEFRWGDATTERRRELLDEAIEANENLLARLEVTLARIGAFRDERAAKAIRLEELREGLEP